MAVQLKNNAATTLSADITSSATSISVSDGSVFPTLSGSDYTYATFEDVDSNREIVKVTAISSNTLTVVRAQDGTTARAFSDGDKCELRITAALLNDIAAQADTDTNTEYTAGSGLTLTGTEFSNSAPDQTVTLTGGTGITTSGTYPNFTVTNSSPDQTVSLTGSGATTVSGTYPNFTISSTDTNTDTDTTYTAGSGLTLTGTTFSNSAPDQTVTLTGSGATSVSGTYPNFTISSTDTNTDTNTEYTAGSGITLTGTVFSNSAPDQTVTLTGSGNTTVSGTYPNFTISSTGGSIDGTTINPSSVQIGGTTVIDSSRNVTGATVKTDYSSSVLAPRFDSSFYVLQSQHWYGQTSSQGMYLGESDNDVYLRGQLSVGGSTVSSTYTVSLNSGSGIHMGNTNIHYANDVHFNSNTRFTNYSSSYTIHKAGVNTAGGLLMRNNSNSTQGYFYWDTGGIGILSSDGSWALQNTNSQTDAHNPLVARGNLRRNAHNTGHLEGSYNSVGANSYNSNPIYTIGSSYNPNSTTLGNMYGIGYTHTNASFIGFAGSSGWGMYVASDGDARVYLSGGTGTGYFTGNVTAYASDRRLKTNIQTIDNALDKVTRIRGVEFDWVDDITSEYDFHPQQMHETGVIAQEIQAVIPDAVVEAPMNGNYTAKCGTDHEFLTVDKEKIVPLLIEAVKELKAEVDALKSQLEEKP